MCKNNNKLHQDLEKKILKVLNLKETINLFLCKMNLMKIFCSIIMRY